MDANSITAMCALVVSVLATCLAVWSAVTQRKHMKLSVKPIAAVPVGDFEQEIGVYLSNKGLGPMLVKKLEVTDKKGNAHSDLISHMPELNEDTTWSSFHGSVDGSFLEQGKKFELLLLEGNPNSASFQKSRDLVRTHLKDLVIRVEYEDLYGQTMETVERELSWFGREKEDSRKAQGR